MRSETRLWIWVLAYGLSSAFILSGLGLGLALELGDSGIHLSGAMNMIIGVLWNVLWDGAHVAGIACVIASIALATHQRWGGSLARVGLIVHVFASISAILLGLSHLVSLTLLAFPHLGIRGCLLCWFEPRYLFSTFVVISFFIVTGAIIRIGWHLFRSIYRLHQGGG